MKYAGYKPTYNRHTPRSPQSQHFHVKKLTTHEETCEESALHDMIEMRDQSPKERGNMRT